MLTIITGDTFVNRQTEKMRFFTHTRIYVYMYVYTCTRKHFSHVALIQTPATQTNIIFCIIVCLTTTYTHLTNISVYKLEYLRKKNNFAFFLIFSFCNVYKCGLYTEYGMNIAKTTRHKKGSASDILVTSANQSKLDNVLLWIYKKVYLQEDIVQFGLR